MLEHRGRRTGNPRYVVLEIVERRTGALVVVSGYGERAQWFKNIQADSAVRVWNGDIRNTRAKATVLSGEESRQILTRYKRDHAAGATVLAKVLGLHLAHSESRRSADDGVAPVAVRIDLLPAGAC